MTITKKTQKKSPSRYVYSVVKQIRLTLQPIIIALLTTLAWYYWVFKKHISFDVSDSESLLLLTGPLLMLALLFVGGLAYTRIEERKDKTVAAIMKREKREFLVIRDEKTSNAVFVFLISVSLLLIAQAMLTHWTSVYAGGFAVFVCTFVSVKFWVLIIRMDNPVKSSRWITERVPKGWMDIDVDKYFNLGESEE